MSQDEFQMSSQDKFILAIINGNSDLTLELYNTIISETQVFPDYTLHHLIERGMIHLLPSFNYFNSLESEVPETKSLDPSVTGQEGSEAPRSQVFKNLILVKNANKQNFFQSFAVNINIFDEPYKKIFMDCLNILCPETSSLEAPETSSLNVSRPATLSLKVSLPENPLDSL